MRNFQHNRGRKSFRSISRFIIILLVSFACTQQKQPARIETLFDEGWKFQLGDVQGAEKPSFNDDDWRSIDLPHDWSIEDLPNQEPGKVVALFPKRVSEQQQQDIQ